MSGWILNRDFIGWKIWYIVCEASYTVIFLSHKAVISYFCFKQERFSFWYRVIVIHTEGFILVQVLVYRFAGLFLVIVLSCLRNNLHNLQ